MAVRVDGQLSGHGHGGGGGRRGGGGGHGGATDVGPHPGDKLPHGEGFCDVVVRTDLQAQNFVGFFLPGGEDDDRDVVTLFPKGAAYVKPVHFRQHHV